MTEIQTPARERQALREVGRTTVRFRTAMATTVLFLAVIGLVPLAQTVIGPSPMGALIELGNGVSEAWRQRRTAGWVASNRRILEALDQFETRLEDESLLRQRLLPPVQSVLSSLVGVGNEQAYVGRGGWLFYRPDVDYVTGPGFLDAEVMERRRRGGDAWELPPEPNPIPALVALARELESRGIELLVMPTPLKPMILPAAMVWRRTVPPPLQNPSWPLFRAALQSERVSVLDVDAWMAAMPSQEEAVFLTTDTHWTPRAMESVARLLAQEVSERLPPLEAPVELERRETTVDGRGDIAVMLHLPDGQRTFSPQRVEISVVTDPGGAAWRPDPAAEVLLLGDSFTNVFSDSSLGWGQGAGLAEQLSYLLSRPVDRIALNAGGSNATRRALIDALVADPDRLATKKIVIYQFAARELSTGDWPLLPLPRD